MEEGGSGEGREGGGGASSRSCIADVHRGNHSRNWTTWIALGVQRLFPVHPGLPILQGLGDGGTDQGGG